jgi:hypothetical protein
MIGTKTREDLVNVGVSTSLYEPEVALINEARRRQARRHRWFKLLLVVAVIATITAIGVTRDGSGVHPGSGTPSSGLTTAHTRQSGACNTAHSNLAAGSHIVSCGTNGGGWMSPTHVVLRGTNRGGQIAR